MAEATEFPVVPVRARDPIAESPRGLSLPMHSSRVWGLRFRISSDSSESSKPQGGLTFESPQCLRSSSAR